MRRIEKARPSLQDQAADYIREAKRREPSENNELVSTVVDAVARNYFEHAVRKQQRRTPHTTNRRHKSLRSPTGSSTLRWFEPRAKGVFFFTALNDPANPLGLWRAQALSWSWRPSRSLMFRGQNSTASGPWREHPTHSWYLPVRWSRVGAALRQRVRVS
jgi:hypothetical protein